MYLIAAHAIPVHRCAELIESLTGAKPSPGFVHSMIRRAAAAVAAANKAIRCLIILAHVVSADETPIRVGPGPRTRKRYLLVACTSLLTCYFLGDRSMKTFAAFVLPDLDGTVVVHDRYQNYDKVPGLIHQLCCQHLQRDLADAAETYPDAHWPVQIAEALQGLIHAANTARGQGLPAIPDDIAAPLIRAFRHGVILGIGQVKRADGRKQQPGRDLLECLRDRQADVLRFTTDLRIPPTSNQPPLFSADGRLSHPAAFRGCELVFRAGQVRRRVHLMGAGRSGRPAGGRPRSGRPLRVKGEERPGSGRLRVTTPESPGTGAPLTMQLNGWDHALKITADGKGLVGHAGAILLRKAADQAGLTAALSSALRKNGTSPLLDRGIVLVPMATAIALGATSMSDIAVLAHLAPVLGTAPSGPTVRRALDLAGTPSVLDRIARARARARAHAWKLIEATPAGFPWLEIAGKTLAGWIIIDMDATLVTAHSSALGTCS